MSRPSIGISVKQHVRKSEYESRMDEESARAQIQLDKINKVFSEVETAGFDVSLDEGYSKGSEEEKERMSLIIRTSVISALVAALTTILLPILLKIL